MIEDIEDKINSAHIWYNQNCAESVKLLYAADQAGATAALEWSLSELLASELHEDSVAYLLVRLRFLAGQIQRIDATPEQTAASFEQLLDYLEAPDPNELGAQVRLMLMIQTRIQMLRDHGHPFSAEEYHRYINQLDPHLVTTEFKLHQGSWAYLNRDLDLMGKLFGDYTINPGDFLVSFTWQTLNLGYQLLRERAGEDDILDLLKVIKHVRQWEFVERVYWHECRELGLVTDRVEEALEAKLAELDETGGTFAQYEKGKQRIRKH